MPPDPSFRELLRRVRAGEQQAATELHDVYGPAIRCYIRGQLTDPRLHRLLDSGDIFQSVLANFFVRVAAGQYDLDEPEQLIKLLVTMARNRIVDYARKPAHRRAAAGGDALWPFLAAPDESPSQILARKELLERARARLTDEERRLAELRADRKDWQAIADACGGTAEGVRKQYTRALDRVCRELGIDEGSDE
jgi:RNA polymerase sigma-70 factor (ECF subfamily)